MRLQFLAGGARRRPCRRSRRSGRGRASIRGARLPASAAGARREPGPSWPAPFRSAPRRPRRSGQRRSGCASRLRRRPRSLGRARARNDLVRRRRGGGRARVSLPIGSLPLPPSISMSANSATDAGGLNARRDRVRVNDLVGVAHVAFGRVLGIFLETSAPRLAPWPARPRRPAPPPRRRTGRRRRPPRSPGGRAACAHRRRAPQRLRCGRFIGGGSSFLGTGVRHEQRRRARTARRLRQIFGDQLAHMRIAARRGLAAHHDGDDVAAVAHDVGDEVEAGRAGVAGLDPVDARRPIRAGGCGCG